MMKLFAKPLAAAALALALFAPAASAAKLTLDGYGYYEFQSRNHYYGHGGAEQNGRYSYLGRGYYHKTEIGMDYLTNRSRRRSGDLSIEFWAMPFYGATSGTILMTRSRDSLGGGDSLENVDPRGQAISLDKRRFPEINVWEYTRRGWKFRDALTFTRKNRL